MMRNPAESRSISRRAWGITLERFVPPVEFANFSRVLVGHDEPWFLFFEYGPDGLPLLVAVAPAVPIDSM